VEIGRYLISVSLRRDKEVAYARDLNTSGKNLLIEEKPFAKMTTRLPSSRPVFLESLPVQQKRRN
uniref:hypothetical protein n=1 Tax=Streptobacillus moniliformis TaxID=34105 RepID=UPI001E36360C